MPFRTDPVVPVYTPPMYPSHEYKGDGESAEVVVWPGGPMAGLLSVTNEALVWEPIVARAESAQVLASLVLDLVRDARSTGATPHEAFNAVLGLVPSQNRTHGPLRDALAQARRALP